MRYRFSAIVVLLTGQLLAGPLRISEARSYAVKVFDPDGIVAASGNGVSAGNIVGSGVGTATGGYSHALLFPNGADEPIDLHPASGYVDTSVEGASGDTQVGWGSVDFGTKTHALLWRGSAESFVDLHPGGYASSYAWDASNDTQVGRGTIGCCGQSVSHALLWRGSAASVVDLTPSGYSSSVAYGASETTQVGFAAANAPAHAVLWRGTADSLVDLHPAGVRASEAIAATETHQVGNLILSNAQLSARAALWSGSAESLVNLHPENYLATYATGVAGDYQVGIGETSTDTGKRHALVWRGSAASAMDLQEALAGQVPGFIGSVATGVDSSGNVVGSAWTENYTWYIVKWNVVLGDTNGDLRVDLWDLNDVRNHFGSDGVGVPGDSNDDGVVDLIDLNDVRNHFGDIASAAVPEPSTLLLTLFGVVTAPFLQCWRRSMNQRK